MADKTDASYEEESRLIKGQEPLDNSAVVEPEISPLTAELSGKRLIIAAIGWLTFSFIFNILNTIVFATLYPLILEKIAPDKQSYAQAFSIINSITTLASAFVLPLLGSWSDSVKNIKQSMIIMQYLGIAATISLFFLNKLPQDKTQLYLNEVSYVIAMFCLRIAVMNNNALIACFPRKYAIALSLLSNFLGFTVNVAGLLVLTFKPDLIPDSVWGVTRENWWLLVFTGITVVLSLATFLAPNDPAPLIKLKFGEGIQRTVASLRETFVLWKHDKRYSQSWLFLLGYMFFSIGGTVVTIFISALFIDIYSIDFRETVNLNLYYKVAMVIGVGLGIAYEKLSKLRDTIILLVQLVMFEVVLIVLYVLIIIKVPYLAVMLTALVIGLLYSWNMSVSRGLMSKLAPAEKKCEFMGLYSTFTYLGISVISGLNYLLRELQLPSETIILWMIPGAVFLVLLHRSISMHGIASLAHQKSRMRRLRIIYSVNESTAIPPTSPKNQYKLRSASEVCPGTVTFIPNDRDERYRERERER